MDPVNLIQRTIALNFMVEGRRARLGGRIEAALSFESKAEEMIKQLFSAKEADEIMTEWECCL